MIDLNVLDIGPNFTIAIMVHMLANALIFGICICRLGKMHNVLLRVKFQYVFLEVAATANGLSPLFFRQWPTVASIFFVCAVLYMLWSDSYQWKSGPPPEAKTQPAPLEELGYPE